MATRPMQVWNGSAWEDIGPQAPATAIVVQSSTPTGDSGKLWIDTSADVPTYASMAPTASPSFTGTSTFAGPVTMSGGAVNMSGATSVTGGGMDLITPTSVAGSGVTLSGGAVSFSAATSISVNGCFSATYKNYRLVLSGVCSSSTPAMNIRMRLAGSDNSTSNYAYQYLDFAGPTITSARSTAQTNYYSSILTTTGGWMVIDVFDPAEASNTYFSTSGGYLPATPGGLLFYGAHSVSTAYDGFSVIPSVGNVTGTLRIYGLRNS